MKILRILIIALCLLPSAAMAGFVNNAGGTATAEDSLAAQFVNLDSLGSAVAMASGDSVYFVCFYPSGSVAFRDSMAYNDSKITLSDWEDFAQGEQYTLRYPIASIDGAGINGNYTWAVIVDDNTGMAWNVNTTTRGTFQLIGTGADLSPSVALTRVDSLRIAATFVLSDTRAVNANASADDSLAAIAVRARKSFDVGEISTSSAAADSLESIVLRARKSVDVGEISTSSAAADSLEAIALRARKSFDVGEISTSAPAADSLEAFLLRATKVVDIRSPFGDTLKDIRQKVYRIGDSLVVYGYGDVIDLGSNTTTVFEADGGNLSAIDNIYDGMTVLFLTGNLKGGARRISSATESFGIVQFNFSSSLPNTSWPQAPADNDRFVIVSSYTPVGFTVNTGSIAAGAIDSADIDLEVYRHIARASSDSTWAKDTSNTLWNGLSRFGEYNALVGPWNATTMDSALQSLDYTNNTNHVLRVTDTNHAWAATGSVSSCGSGSPYDTLKVLDTSGTDALVPYAYIEVYDITGTTLQAWGFTGANGRIVLRLTASTSFLVNTSKNGFTFPQRTITTGSGANYADSTMGYDVSIAAATTNGYKRVWGYEYINQDSSAGPASGVWVSATLSYRTDPGSVIPQDTLNDNNLGKQVTVYTRTNTNGYWQLDVPINTNILPTNSWWQFTAQNRWSVGYRFTTTTVERLSSLTGF